MFCCLGGGVGPAQTAKKKNRPNRKNKHDPDPAERVFFLLFGRVGMFIFCCLGGMRVYFFAVWAGGVLFFCCLGGVVLIDFFCLGGGVFFFCCLGGGEGGGVVGACFFSAVWALFFLLFGRGTGVHSLTGLPGSSLRERRPNKKKHWLLPRMYTYPLCSRGRIPPKQKHKTLNSSLNLDLSNQLNTTP